MSVKEISQICKRLKYHPGKSRLFAGIVLLSGLFISAQAFATTLVYKSFDDLVKEADGIVAGHVASIESKTNANNEIYTFVTLDHLEVLGGSYQGQTLTLRFKGGQVGNNISRILGSPEFNLNDQVVLFVEGNGQYMVPVVGWTQGVFRVVQDAATGRQVILDHEHNRVLGVQVNEILREQNVQPAANIVGQNKNVVSAASQNNGAAGRADNNSQPVAPLTTVLPSVLAAMPTMTSDSFLSTVRKSASVKVFQRGLKSISVGDFSLAPNSNADSTVGEKVPAVALPAAQGPTAPQRKPAPQPQNQF